MIVGLAPVLVIISQSPISTSASASVQLPMRDPGPLSDRAKAMLVDP